MSLSSCKIYPATRAVLPIVNESPLLLLLSPPLRYRYRPTNESRPRAPSRGHDEISAIGTYTPSGARVHTAQASCASLAACRVCHRRRGKQVLASCLSPPLLYDLKAQRMPRHRHDAAVHAEQLLTAGTWPRQKMRAHRMRKCIKQTCSFSIIPSSESSLSGFVLTR